VTRDHEDKSSNSQPDGVLVLGLPGAGHLFESLLRRSGLTAGLRDQPGDLAQRLAEFNDLLFEKVDASREHPPLLPSSDLLARLSGMESQARDLFSGVLDERSQGPESVPWSWYDPSNCFLADFWAQALGHNISQLMVVVPPLMAVTEAMKAYNISWDEAERLWVDYHRAALAQCESRPSKVVAVDSLLEPKLALTGLDDFLGRRQQDMHIPAVANPASSTTVDRVSVGRELSHAIEIFWSFLHKLGEKDSVEFGSTDADLVSALEQFYDEEYYENSLGENPYRRGVEEWDRFFNAVAERIVDTLKPKSVLDAGCAIGFLVEALRDRGVDARGFDISQFAISQAPEALAPYVSVRSITDEIDGQFDLIFCIEVVEHLTPRMAEDAIANLCRHTDAVLFSSSPEDFEEATHINVRAPEDWARTFARNGFHRDFDYDASYMAPQAVLFRRSELDAEQLISGYERKLWRSVASNGSQLATYQEQIDAGQTELEASHQRLGQAASAVDEVQHQLDQLKLRRAAEQAASTEALDEQGRQQTRLAAEVEIQKLERDQWQQEVENLHATKLFRYSAKLRTFYGRFRSTKAAPDGVSTVEPAEPIGGGSFDLWVENYDTMTDTLRADLARRVGDIPSPPVISVLVPVYNTPEPFLRAAIESVRRQIYPHWELCIADDRSTEPHVRELLSEYQVMDDRIKVVFREENGHISAASNSALQLASGSWIALLDHDDELSEHALAIVALALAKNPAASYVYSDEDKLDERGRRFSPFFKPEFDPVMLLGENYPCHLSVARRDLVEGIGGFRLGFEGSQDWDLVLRITEGLEPQSILHLPFILYHWRVHPDSTASSGEAKPYTATAGVRAVEEHLTRLGRSGDVSWLPATQRNRVTWRITEQPPLVSIIIPTRNGRYLARCIDSVRRLTTYADYEILVVDNGSLERGSLHYLRVHENDTTVIRDERPFNYSALNNMAAGHARGELICLLNDDVEAMGGEWLEEMVAQIIQPDVGIVGAKLNYQNGTIQHAGVTLGIHGVAGHLHRGAERFDLGYFGDLALVRRVSAVTGACMLIRKEVWTQLGGLDEKNLSIAFNDVDFCLRAGEVGWKVMWTPFAELTHHESISRGPDDVGPRAEEFKLEVDYMKKRWADVLHCDPAYNPNLTLLAEHATLAWPPRVSYHQLC
jgi:GT2 family glycosyltransferase/SAM-dependent methyltransferase